MKTTAITNGLSKTANKFAFKLKKHSSEILVVTGIVGTVASAVMACKATTKLSSILDESKENVNQIHEASSNEALADEYTPEDAKKDLALVYVQTGIKIAKIYAPAVILGTLSITSILASNNILRKRNVALAAAYATVDKGFKEYRNRVVERFGQEIDKELRYNLKAQEYKETVVDEETGKHKKVKKTQFVVNPSDISGYARFFEEYTMDKDGKSIKNTYWNKENEYNIMFLKGRERYANDLLKTRGYLFLNEVYDMLGLPISKAGQVVGWVYDPDNGRGDSYVSFGMYLDNLSYSDYINGFDPALLLDFNVDGNIWELM